MRATSGIFGSRADTDHTARKLRPTGLARDQITLIVPGAVGKQPQRLPVSAAEQPTVCKALGAVTGAAVGLADGFVLGAVVSAADPGVGSVTAIGFLFGTILGLAGAAVGAAAGSALDSFITDGLPEGELLVYEDALRKSRSVVLAFPHDRVTTESARGVPAEEGAESIDPAPKARTQWWTGRRSAEQQDYLKRDVVTPDQNTDTRYPLVARTSHSKKKSTG
jgi:hypothetical protein